MIPVGLLVALLPAVAAYSLGYHSCPASVLNGAVPGHGTTSSATPFSFKLQLLGQDVTEYDPAETGGYSLQLTSTTGASFRGFIIGNFVGAQFTSFLADFAGTLSTTDSNAQRQNACDGLTHRSAISRTSLTMKWVPPAAGTGPVTFYAVIVTSRTGANYGASLTVPELGGSTGGGGGSGDPSATPTPSPTASNSPTPTRTPSVSQSPSNSRTPSPTSSTTPSSTATSSVTPSVTPSIGAPPSLSPSPTPTRQASATPSVTPSPSSSPLSEGMYRHTATLAAGLDVSWSVDTRGGTVQFQLLSDTFAWIALAPATSYSMLTGTDGAGYAVIGKPLEGTVQQYEMRSYDAAFITPVSAERASISNSSIAFLGGQVRMRWTQAMQPPPGSLDKPLNVVGETGFVYAVGRGAAFEQHDSGATGFARLTLSPGDCTREVTCNNRGDCSCYTCFPCACDIGYAGDMCTRCAAGFVPSATSTASSLECVLQAPDTAAVRATMRLMLPFDSVGAEGSTTRAAFISSFTQDVASALEVSPSRVRVVGLRPGSILVDFSILPPLQPTSTSGTLAPNDALSVSVLASMLSQQLASPQSRLRSSGTVTTAADPAIALQLNFQPPQTYSYTVDITPSLQLSWSIDDAAGLVRMQLSRQEPSGTSAGWTGIAVQPAGTAAMIGGDAIVVEPSRSNAPISAFTLGSKDMSAIIRVDSSASSLDETSAALVVERATSSSSSTVSAWTASFARTLAAGPGGHAIPADGGITLIAAWGSSGSMAIHTLRDSAVLSINLRTGAAQTLSSATAAMRVAHGVMMTAAWAVLVPAGIAAARYMRGVKQLRGKVGGWYRVHTALQYTAAALFIAAFIIALAMTPTGHHFSHTHNVIGLIVVLLGVLQPAAAVRWRDILPCCRADDEDSSADAAQQSEEAAERAAARQRKLRMAWVWAHRSTGWCVAGLAAAAMFTGLAAAQASAGYTVAYAVWLAITVILFVTAEGVMRRQHAAGNAGSAAGTVAATTTVAGGSSKGMPLSTIPGPGAAAQPPEEQVVTVSPAVASSSAGRKNVQSWVPSNRALPTDSAPPGAAAAAASHGSHSSHSSSHSGGKTQFKPSSVNKAPKR